MCGVAICCKLQENVYSDTHIDGVNIPVVRELNILQGYFSYPRMRTQTECRMCYCTVPVLRNATRSALANPIFGLQ